MNIDRLIQDIRKQTGTQLDEDDPIAEWSHSPSQARTVLSSC